METSRLSYPAAGAIILALSAIAGARLAKRPHLKERDVEAILVLLGMVIVVGINQIGGLPDLKRIQSMLNQILATMAVFLWGIIIIKMRSNSAKSLKVAVDASSSAELAAKESKAALLGLTGPPNFIEIHGQNVQAPFKYSSISGLNNAVVEAEVSVAALRVNLKEVIELLEKSAASSSEHEKTMNGYYEGSIKRIDDKIDYVALKVERDAQSTAEAFANNQKEMKTNLDYLLARQVETNERHSSLRALVEQMGATIAQLQTTLATDPYRSH